MQCRHIKLVAMSYHSLLLPGAAEKTVLLTVMICLNRKYKRAASISKIILTLDDIVFIDTQVSKKVGARVNMNKQVYMLLWVWGGS